MINYEVIIGIEIHLELNTKTKMFSSAPNNFKADPNTQVSVIDLAYPGTLPQLNKQAVVKSIKLAKALNMSIDKLIRFDRKNYFYPDLPKGYQITQQYHPIGKDGIVNVLGKKIEIERIHMEEDTAKSSHEGDLTLLDFNRAGVPLIEIVSRPDIRNAKEAAKYVETIRDIALALDISDAKMEEGSLRADVNISIRPFGFKGYGTKVEIKNMNSLSNIESAIEFEINEQIHAISNGGYVKQVTKRFDEATKTNVVMRDKTDSVDYKYFHEPNIPHIRLSDEFVDSIKIEEMPWEREKRYLSQGIEQSYVDKLLWDLDKAKWFDQLNFNDKGKAAKLFFAEVVSLANEKGLPVSKLSIPANEFDKCLKYIEEGKISGKQAKDIIPLLTNNETVDEIISKLGFEQISDPNTLRKMIDEIIKNNLEFINSNKDKRERVEKFIIGLLMKNTKGQANPVVSNKIMLEELEKNV